MSAKHVASRWLKRVRGSALPNIPKITPREVEQQLALYWDPRKQKIDPTAMGDNLAKDVRPLIKRSFRDILTVDLVLGKFFERKGLEIKELVESTFGDIGRSTAETISSYVSMGPDMGQPMLWLDIFDPHSPGLAALEEFSRQLRHGLKAAEKYNIGKEQQNLVADWIDTFRSDVIALGKKIEKQVEWDVTMVMEKLLKRAAQGIPPRK